MSRIYFHTRDEGQAEVLGSERAHFGCVVSDVSAAFIPHFPESVLPFIQPGHYMHTLRHGPAWQSALRTSMTHGDGDLVLYQGKPVESFSLQLNTLIAIGSEPLKLAAWIHGQCELHGYVEGPSRAWLAGVIEKGRETGLYRASVGWEDVTKLLRAAADAPVVMSYSVCDSFPNSHVARWEAPTDEDGESDYDAWYEIPEGERWDLAMAGLRADSSITPLFPQGLSRRFGHGLTFIDIFSQDRPSASDPRPGKAP